MNRKDLVALELHYAGMLRREAKSRAKRYPAIADQMGGRRRLACRDRALRPPVRRR